MESVSTIPAPASPLLKFATVLVVASYTTKGVDAVTTKGAGGTKFKQKFDNLKGPLAEAGITVEGTGKNEKFYTGKATYGTGGNKIQKTVEQAGTPEQKEIVANYITERDRVIGIRDSMRAEMKAKEKEIENAAPPGAMGSKIVDTKAIAEAKAEIRGKYEAQLNGVTTSPKIDSNSTKNNLSTLNETEPQIIDATTNSGGGNMVSGGNDELTTSLPNIPSSNSDNKFTLYSQTQYNMVM